MKRVFKPILLPSENESDNFVPANKKPYKVFYPFHTPNNIDDLTKIDDFMEIMKNGFSFMHYRKDSVFHLSEELFKNLKSVHYVDTHDKPIKEILNEITSSAKNQAEYKIWVIDSTKYHEDISKVYEGLSKLTRKIENTGICIRANIEDINIKSLEYFDIIYLFDMSSTLFDKLRSFISIPSVFIEYMKTGETVDGEPVLIYLNNKRVAPYVSPVFSTNPFMVSCDSSLTTTGKFMSDSTGKNQINIENFQGVLGNIKDSDFTQNLELTISKNDKESLFKYLKNHSVETIDIKALQHALELDPAPLQPDKFGKNVTDWILKMINKSADGTWNVSIAAAGNILGAAIAKYYGVI